jgi:hypothetical protein
MALFITILDPTFWVVQITKYRGFGVIVEKIGSWVLSTCVIFQQKLEFGQIVLGF